jgi:hypothetical protein
MIESFYARVYGHYETMQSIAANHGKSNPNSPWAKNG